MFLRSISEEIKMLNSDVNSVANCERAKKLRKTLLSIGLPMAIIGFLSLFACFISFALIAVNSVGTFGFPKRIIIPFIFFIPSGVVGGIGTSIASLGFKIVIVGYTSDLVDKTLENRCPNCGDKIAPEEIYCSECGTMLKKVCSKCNHVNNVKNKYCEKCGNNLD